MDDSTTIRFIAPFVLLSGGMMLDRYLVAKNPPKYARRRRPMTGRRLAFVAGCFVFAIAIVVVVGALAPGK